MQLKGKCSWFGGPHDAGVDADEGLAFIDDTADAPELFLDRQPPGTTGLARRLNPDTFYIACRWDYDQTPPDMLLDNRALVHARKTGRTFSAAPADWGPHEDTGRIADISPGLMDALGITTDDEIEIVFPVRHYQGVSVPLNPLCIDLSHWDPADDYDAVRNDGIVGVIYKATEGQGYTDPTYVQQQQAAKTAGLLWGAYHFADASDVDGQIANFLRFAAPDPDELFCLDWEDNEGDTMPLDDVKVWIDEVERALNRPGECVLYGGNTIKERANADKFLVKRRLWLCQYGSEAVLPDGWSDYFLWQYTDGVYGPGPHSINGVGPCDINHYEGTPDELAQTWASGTIIPTPPPIPQVNVVNIIVVAAPDISVKVRQVAPGQIQDYRRRRAKESL